ncbi:MFS transporter [Mycobacteroides sp. LB1]|uniref:MFS transporter n=1 Tax=Mycobacteroides sp. LB1 TaxID=2750814 RepID=UPI0015DDA28A|nr:MFS transporter [Mycobacteroides sp. LB1]
MAIRTSTPAISGARPTPHLTGTPGYRRLTGALFAAGLATFAALYGAQAVLPALSADLGVAPAAAALTVSVTTGMLALSIIPASALSERFGRTRVMLVSAIATTIIGLLLPASPNFTVLLVGRAAEGVALAGIPAVAMAFLAEEVHPGSLGSAMGRYVAGTTVGGLAGRLVASSVLDVSNWRIALLGSGVMTLVCTVLFAVLLPRSQFFVPKSVRVGTTVRILGTHLRNPVLLIMFGLGFLLMGGFVTVYNYLGYRLVAAPFGLPTAIAGLLFLLYLAGTVSSAMAGRLADRRGRGLVLIGAVAVTAVGLALTVPNSLITVIIGVGIFTAGFFGAHTVASGWVGAVAQRDRAEASALYLFSYYLGSSVAGAAGGLAYQAGGWPMTVTFVGALLTLALVLAAVMVLRNRFGHINTPE